MKILVVSSMGLDQVSILQLTTKTALFRSIYDEGIKVRYQHGTQK